MLLPRIKTSSILLSLTSAIKSEKAIGGFTWRVEDPGNIWNTENMSVPIIAHKTKLRVVAFKIQPLNIFIWNNV